MAETMQKVSCPVCGNGAAPDQVQLGGYRLYHCPGCALRFAPQAFGVPVDYDRVYQSPEYEADQVNALRSLNPTSIADHATYRSFFRQVPHTAKSRLLDVGCGVGRFGVGAFAKGWDVTGIDVSARAIEAGRGFVSFPLRVATVEELGTAGEQFDVVTAFEVLEHLSAPVEFLSHVRKLVRPGGQIFCTVPNWNSAVVRSSTRPDWLPPIHLLFFDSSSLRALAERSGLTRVRTGLIWSDPMPTSAGARTRWLARRLLGRPQEPLGIWVHGWVPD
jgi:SAM-dependent methyltransferase